MKADWTKRDTVITEALRKYGRNSVPLYLLFGTDPSQPPQILPQSANAGHCDGIPQKCGKSVHC